MTVYYILSGKRFNQYNMTSIVKGDKNIPSLLSQINKTPNFCREEESIKTTELVGYLASGITLYSLDENNTLLGVLNFDVNGDKINILGLCAPEPSLGVGTLLINTVKMFAEQNQMKTVQLTCYGDVVNFYTNPRIGFRILNQHAIPIDSDSDSDDEDSERKMKYDLSYHVISGGRRKSKIRRKYRRKNTRKSRRKNTRKSRRKNTRKSRYFF